MTDPLVRSVQVSFPQVYHACHTRHVRARTSPAGLSARDASLLAHLDRLEGASAASLARHLGVGPSTLSAALRHLEELGHVERAPHADDRRRVELRLTPKGAAVVQRSSVLDTERVQRLLARLEPRERAAAVRGLELLARAARELMDAEPRRGR